jgi:branched-subunit amino acid ABC-type transport system permease component
MIFEVLKLGFFYGCFIGMVAIGFALIYNILHIVDFAHTDRLTVSGYVFVSALTFTNHFIAILLAIAAGIVFAFLSELLIYRQVRKFNPKLLLLTTFGLSIVIQNVLAIIFNDGLKEYPVVEQTILQTNLYIRELIIFPALLIISLLLYYWLKKTKTGLSIRASISNLERATTLGVPINKIYLIVFVFSGIIAGLGGVYLSMGYGLTPYSGFKIMILAFSACLIAGMNNIYGSVIVGIIIGISLSVFEMFFNALSAELFTLLSLITILFIKPQGIFGKRLRII